MRNEVKNKLSYKCLSLSYGYAHAKNYVSAGIFVGSLFVLFSCNKSGGGGGSQAPLTQVPGVEIRNYIDNSQGVLEQCNVGPGIYSCTSPNGTRTGDIRFSTLQEFCQKINDDTINNGAAYRARREAFNQQCNRTNNGFDLYNNTNYNPNNPNGFNQNNLNSDTQNFKMLQCQLKVARGNLVSDTGVQNIPIINNGSGWVDLYGNATSNSRWGFLNFHQFTTTHNLVKVGIRYLPATTSNANNNSATQISNQNSNNSFNLKDRTYFDKVEISAKGINNGDTDVIVTGFAGSDTTLEVGSEDDSDRKTYVYVSCRTVNRANSGPQLQMVDYKCRGQETIKKDKASIMLEYAYDDNLIDQSLPLSDSASVMIANSLNFNEGLVQFSQEPRLRRGSGLITTSANVTTASKIEIKRRSEKYNLNVTCGPTK